MKAAIYARYSSDLQRPASIDDQFESCRREIAARGWTESATFSDAEVSGTVAGRPGYQAMMAAARKREFDVLIVDELSRLTRDPEELAGLRKRLHFWGVGLRTLADGIDTIRSPLATAPLMAMRGMVNEAEGLLNAHRSRRGLRGRVLAHHHAGGAPYGYRTRPVHADRPGEPEGTGPVLGYEYVIHEAEAAIIRRIFQLYVDGMGTRQIAATLNAEGIAPPGARWRNRRGVQRTWSHNAIAGDSTKGTGLLNNRKYSGRLLWNRSTWPRDPEQDGKQVRRELPREEWVTVDAPELRIVLQDLWAAAKQRQRERSRRTGNAGAHKRHHRLLSGFLLCGQCGARLVLSGRNSYSCPSRLNRGVVVCDNRATVNAGEAEDVVLDLVRSVVLSKERLNDLTAAINQRLTAGAARQQEDRAQVNDLQRRLGETEATIDRLVEAVASGALVEELQQRMQQAEAQRAQLRREIAVADRDLASTVRLMPAAVRAIIDNLGELLRSGQVQELRAALGRLVDRIEIHAEEPRPGKKRPGARLIFRGNLLGAIRLALQKSKTCNSPGGILHVLRNVEEPPYEVRLTGRRGGGAT